MKRLIIALLLPISLMAQSAPIMTVVPDTTQVALSQTTTTQVNYTVTNATTAANLVGLTVDPTQGGGFPSNVTLMNDTCTGSTLAPSASCTFTLQLSGQGLKEDFALSPRVCANNETACSQPISSNRTQVTVGQFKNAYLAIADSTIVPVEETQFTEGVPLTGFDFNQSFEGITLSLDRQTLFVPNGGNNTLDIINLSTGETTASVTVGTGPFSAAPQPNSNFVYVGNYDGTVSLVNVQNQTTSTFPASFDFPYAFTFSPDGSIVYIHDYDSSSGCTISAFDTSNGNSLNQISGIPCVDFLLPFAAPSPDGLLVVVSITGPSLLALFNPDLSGPVNVVTLPTDSYPTAVLVSPDNSTAYVSCIGLTNGGLILFDLNNQTIINSYDNLGFSSALSFDSTGENLYYIPLFNGPALSVFNLKSMTFRSTSFSLPDVTLNIGLNPVVQ